MTATRSTDHRRSGLRKSWLARTFLLTQHRWIQQLILVGLSGTNAVSKLTLSLYAARYLGLADLGIFGLLGGAAMIVPAVLGFGLTDYVGRRIVALASEKAIPHVFTRLALTVAMHLIALPVAWLVNAALGSPISPTVVLMVWGILLLTHLYVDMDHILTLRGHVYFASIVSFINAGLWPPLVIAWGLLDPAARTLEHLLFGWLMALCLSWSIIAIRFALRRAWRHVRLEIGWIAGCIRPSLTLYLSNLNFVGSLHLDRFLVAAFLGLELTGVYTFFWSVANTMHLLALVVTHPYMGKLVAAGHKVDLPEFRRLEQRLTVEMMVWAVLLGGCAAVAMHLLLPYMQQPMLLAHREIVWILLIATLGRLMADVYDFILYALRRDLAYVGASATGTAVSAALNLLLLPLAGLHGAAAAFLLTNLILLVLRIWLARHGTVHPVATADPSQA